MTLGVAGSLGAVLYGVSSSLPFLASSATSDAHFGALNTCAQAALSNRTGFAVAPDGRSLAVFSGSQLVRCDALPDAGAALSTLPVTGITAVAFDFDGGLWLAANGVHRLDAHDAGFGEIAAISLAGTAHGVVALEGSGRVLALEEGGVIGSIAQLPKSVEGASQLIVSPDGERVALPVSGGVFVWDAKTLASVRAEAPCTVEAAWWRPTGRKLLLSCAPDFGLEWDVESGAQAAVPRKPSQRSVLVPALGIYQQGCEQLPCTSALP